MHTKNVVYHSFLTIQDRNLESYVIANKYFLKMLRNIEKKCQCQIKTSLHINKNLGLQQKSQFVNSISYLKTEVFYNKPYKHHELATRLIGNLFKFTGSDRNYSLNRLSYKTSHKLDQSVSSKSTQSKDNFYFTKKSQNEGIHKTIYDNSKLDMYFSKALDNKTNLDSINNDSVGFNLRKNCDLNGNINSLNTQIIEICTNPATHIDNNMHKPKMNKNDSVNDESKNAHRVSYENAGDLVADIIYCQDDCMLQDTKDLSVTNEIYQNRYSKNKTICKNTKYLGTRKLNSNDKINKQNTGEIENSKKLNLYKEEDLSFSKSKLQELNFLNQRKAKNKVQVKSNETPNFTTAIMYKNDQFLENYESKLHKLNVYDKKENKIDIDKNEECVTEINKNPTILPMKTFNSLYLEYQKTKDEIKNDKNLEIDKKINCETLNLLPENLSKHFKNLDLLDTTRETNQCIDKTGLKNSEILDVNKVCLIEAFDLDEEFFSSLSK